jgi:hypothetical protein
MEVEQNLVIRGAFNKGNPMIGSTILEETPSLPCQDFPESFAGLTSLLIDVQASLQHVARLLRIANPRQLFSKPRVASEFSTNENSISLFPLSQGSARAGADTLATGKAS